MRPTGDFLEIHVSASHLPGCPAGSAPLRGVGNDAQRCTIYRDHGMTEQMASGIARALHFTVTLAVRGARRTGKVSDADDDLVRIAEEVAGNLY